MSREKKLKALGLPADASKIEEMQERLRLADSEEEKAEIAEMLQTYQQMNIDDRLDIVISEYPLKYILRALIQRYGKEDVQNAWEELTSSS